MRTKLQFRRVASALIIIGSVTLLTGCAQITAVKQPKPFKPTATVVGAQRVTVAGELGSPVSSEEQNGHIEDTYKYVDGGGKNCGTSKTIRVVLYSAGDLFTLFLDQVLTWPAETYGFAGTTHLVTISYAKGDDGFWHVKEINDQAQGVTTNTVASAKTGSPRGMEQQTAPAKTEPAPAKVAPAPAAAEPAPAKVEPIPVAPAAASAATPAPAATEPAPADTSSAPAKP